MVQFPLPPHPSVTCRGSGPEVGLALPKLAGMVGDFGIEPEVAFALCRPALKERPIWKEADVREHLGEVCDMGGGGCRGGRGV